MINLDAKTEAHTPDETKVSHPMYEEATITPIVLNLEESTPSIVAKKEQ